jgi:hypothetical protein
MIVLGVVKNILSKKYMKIPTQSRENMMENRRVFLKKKGAFYDFWELILIGDFDFMFVM